MKGAIVLRATLHSNVSEGYNLVHKHTGLGDAGTFGRASTDPARDILDGVG
jgi:hypothetical protein